MTVDITGHSGTDLTLDPASASLTFTTTNWATAQTVTVEADQDDDAVDDTATLVHTASGGGYDSVTGDLPVTVTEDDTAQVTGVMLTAGDARLEVEWTAVANATGYKVQWKSGGQDYDPATRQATVSSGSTTSHQIDSLANGTEYTVQVIAVRSGANDGPPSDEVMGTPKVPNTSAVGLPMITGTAEVGETLTANTSGITDVDGLINVSYRYRWIRVDGNDETDIADATDSTYVLVTDDAGTTLKVEVTFTDDADHEQTLVSAPTQVIQDLRPYVTLASPNAYHLETLGLHANEATGRPVTLVVLFSAEVTGLEAEEFVIENGEVTDVYWVDCLSNPSRVRWCIVMQPADAQDERMTLTIPENIADGGNQPAPEVYYAVLRGTAPTGTFTTAAVEPVSRDFLARLTFDQDMLEDAPGTETLVFPEEEYLKSLDFQVPVEAVARITDFTHADDGSTIQVRIYPPGLLYQEPMSVVLPAGAALSETGYSNPELKLEVLVDTFTGSTLEALALTDLEFSPALDFATIRDHAASVGNEVVATEVTATPTVAGAIVEIEPPDADPDTAGHQVALDVGDTTVTVTVKDANSPDLVTDGSVNKSWQQTYEVVITRAPAKVSLARTGAVQNVEEGSDAPFTLTRIGDQTQPLEVFVEVEGAEWLSPGNWPTQVTIPIGATVHEFTVETNDDDAERENGAITVRVLAGSEYEVTDADAGEASIEINDNDTRSLVLSRSSLEVPEAGSANYTVKLVSQPSADVTVAITGHSDTDLTLDPASASLTFTALNWATAQTVVVSAAQDSDATNDRATLTHTASGGGYDSVTRDLEVAVTDTTRVQLAAVVEDVPEGGSRPIRAMLPMPLDEDVTITVAVVPNDGTDGGRADEYELSANTTLTIAAGTTESTGAVIFTSLDDSDYTGTRLFDATLTPGHPRVDADTAEIAVVDDDNTIIGWIVNPSTIFENGGEATLRAFKTELNQGVVKMALSLQPSDRAVLSGTTLTFQPGAIYAAETLTITAVDNAADEPDQTITISATVTEGRGVRTPEPQELTIVDDDNMSPDVALVLTPSQVRESLVSTVTAVASGPLDDEATITVSASPGHADTRTDDYVLSANTVLTIPAGGTRSTQTVTIASVDDPLSGGSRTREVTVSGTVTGGGGAADPDDRTLTILEDDRQVLLDLVATPATITEGEVSTITLHAFQPVPADVTVTVEHSNDAAELSANPVLMIAAGQTDSTGVVTLTALQDADIRTEIVELRGTPSDDSQFVSVNYGAQVIIIDDDDMRDAQVSVTPAPTQVFEGGTSTFTANLNQPLSDEVTITVGVDEAHPDHTAAADHFTLSANRTLTIPAGSMHSTDVVTLTASNDDYYYGPSRTVVLDFSATGIDQKRILDYNTWIILEDEAQPRVTLSVAPASIAENGGQSMVAASLNTIVESDVEVTVTTAPVVAAEADDFTQSATLLTIPAGRKNSTGNLTINAVDDAIDGPDKHFVVQGTVEVVGMEQSGLVWFPYAEGLTIRDDDEALVVLSTSSLDVAEGSSNTYTVVLGSQPTAEVTIDITGHSGTDLTLDPASAMLTFTTSNWSEAQTVTVEADQDDDAVDDTATLVHTASGGGYDSVTGDLPVTVTEDDTAQVTGVMLTAGDARLEVEWTAVANATGYKVQWKSGGQDYDPATRQATVSSGSTTSHQIDSLANGTEYTVQVIAVRSGANDGPPSDEVMGTPKVPNTSAVGLPMITGTAEVGETLTADTSGITDVDGLINVSYRYRWIRVDGNDETDIADATDSTYVLVTDDAGTTLKVEVTFTDDADHEQTLVSAPTQVIQDLRPYVTLASPNAYHLETLGLHANEATGRPVTLVVLFSAEVTGLEAEEFVIENGEVTNVFWVDCLSNPSRVRWCIVMQPADAQDERMTLTIPENIADGGNQPALEVYYAVLRGTAPTGTFTTAAVEPVSRDFLARLTFDQDMLEDAPGTETLVFPEKEYLKSPDFVVPDEAVARITPMASRTRTTGRP